MDKNYIFLKHKTIMTRSFISQNLAGGGVKIYRLITEPDGLSLSHFTIEKIRLPMELKSTDSLLMTYTIKDVSGLTCYTTQTNTVILPLQGISERNKGEVGIPMFSGTVKKFIGMRYYPSEEYLSCQGANEESDDVMFIIRELYLLR